VGGAPWAWPGLWPLVGVAMAVLVVDNGGCSCKVGWAGQEAPSQVAPNATAHQKSQLDVFVADQIDTKLKNHSNVTYTRPCERGIVTNWQCQMEVWQRMFGLVLGKTGSRDKTLAVTEAPFTPPSVSRCLQEIAFEEFGFHAVHRTTAPCAAAYLHTRQNPEASLGTALVVDLGFSATHAVPYVDGRAVQRAVRRLNIGGKLMTNFLKETVSYRQYNMMDEFHLINQAKESLCYVAQDFEREVKDSCGPSVPADRSAYREWVLPDYHAISKGYQKDLPVVAGRFQRTPRDSTEEQALRLEIERFAVPELLFHPTDCGMHQAGLPNLVAEALAACAPAHQPLLARNIVIVGGGARLPGLEPRLARELQPLLPAHCVVQVHQPNNPELCAWKGLSARAAADPEFLRLTKGEYEELGADRALEVFSRW